MFRRPVKSALLIDFDNIVGPLGGGREFVRSIPNWMAWFEDGKFDDRARKRKFVEKRVYWNLDNDQHHRTAFTQGGFDAMACRSLVRHKKSAADMIIALDALESAFGERNISEYILLTTDTDFVPLLERLGDRKKDTVVTVIADTASGRVYPDHADIVIPITNLRGALNYKRPEKLLRRAYRGVQESSARMAGGVRRVGEGAAGLGRKTAQVFGSLRRNKKQVEAPPSEFAIAAKHLAELAAKTPGSQLGRRTVVRWLSKRMPKRFNSGGRVPFLGSASYADMINRIVACGEGLQLVKYPNGGVAVMVPAKADED
jgi:uncharacterized LabA/DUF88 family protein